VAERRAAACIRAACTAVSSTVSIGRGIAIALAPCMLAIASPARADPCGGRSPASGQEFAGVVRYVGDGDSLCIGPKGRPELWIEVRLADFYAPELHEDGGAGARRRLLDIVIGKPITCRAGRRSYDRVVALCRLGGRPLGDLLRERGGSRADAPGAANVERVRFESD